MLRGDRAASSVPGGCRSAACAAVLGILLAATAGCSRAFYRQRADRDVYALVDCGSYQTGGELGGYTIQPSPASRMYDPDSPDCPPMPPDDPVSHQLMHCVDGKRGWRGWPYYGKTPYVENPCWMACLPFNQQGQVVLDRKAAVELALLHSREYQRELEDLYLSALDVTFERFQFDAQFFGGNSTFFTADGPSRAGGRQSLLETDTDMQMQRLFASGGELVVGMANSLVWQFAGPDEYNANTLLDFSLVQPLLRAGGRAVVLESLTDTERALLANIRQMERFRRGFYAQIVAGRTAVAVPSRGGVGFGDVSTGVSRSAGGFLGLLAREVQIRNQRSNVAGLRSSVDRLQAFYEAGLVESQQVGITRQSLLDAQSNLLQLNTQYERDLDTYKILLGLPPQLDIKTEDRLLAPFDLIRPEMTATQDAVAGFLDRLREPAEAAEISPQQDYSNELASVLQDVAEQLDLAHKDVETLVESLPARRASLRRMADREESKRGEIDPAIYAIDGLHRRVVELTADLEGIERAKQRGEQWNIEPQRWGQFARIERAKQRAEQWDDTLEQGEAQLIDRAQQQYGITLAETDLGRWEQLWNANLEQGGDQLMGWARQWDLKLEETEFRPWEELLIRWQELKHGLAGQLKTTLDELKLFDQIAPQPDVNGGAGASLDSSTDLVTRLSSELLELSLIQARARLDTVTLVPIEMDAREAFEIARRNRRDWMNARAALVDTWRQIEVVADDLQSDLDVTFSGDINTTDNNPVRFRGTTGRLRVGLEFDAPLTRLAERNAYRETLIAYQQARREYYATEDRIGASLRDTIRTIRLNQLNFEVQRASVFVAVARVDEAREELSQPGGAQLGLTTARNLVEALSALLRAQNSFLAIWVDQEALRLNLDLDLGTMRLDGRGMWIDPGPVGQSDAPRTDEADEAPVAPDPHGQPEELPTPPGEPIAPPTRLRL